MSLNIAVLSAPEEITTPTLRGLAAELGPREDMTDQDVATAVQDRRRRDWSRMAILYVAAFFGAFIIAFSVFRMTATERPSVTAVTIHSANAAEPLSEATTEPGRVGPGNCRVGPGNCRVGPGNCTPSLSQIRT
jgi:hypothetical protein